MADGKRAGGAQSRTTNGGRHILGRGVPLVFMAYVVLLVATGAAFAKSGSVPWPAPAADQQVFSASLAGAAYSYTWADVSGAGTLGAAVTQSYLKDTDEQDPQDWTGVWLRTVLADLEARSGIALGEDWRLRLTTVDGHVCGLFVADVKDPANAYLLAMDAVRGCDGDPEEATVWYDPTYVRICRTGDYGNTAYPARLVATSGSMIVLDAGGQVVTAPATAAIVVTSPTVSQAAASVAAGTQLALRAVVTKGPGAPQAEPVVWSSANDTVAAVSQTGTVTARAVGTAVIRATSGTRVDAFTVKVVAKPVKATGIALPKTKKLRKGASVPLKARIAPAGSTATITWKSGAAKIASVDRTGRVTALRRGKATITVRTSNGKSARCVVTVL